MIELCGLRVTSNPTDRSHPLTLNATIRLDRIEILHQNNVKWAESMRSRLYVDDHLLVNLQSTNHSTEFII
jgi:hypothetical protein